MKYFFILIFFTVSLFASVNVEKNISYFEQKDTLKENSILNEKFLSLDSKYSNFGFSNSIYWLKVELKNNLNRPSKQVLHFPYTLLDYIDIYKAKNSKLLLIREYGDLRIYKNDGNIPDPSFITTLNPNETKIYYYKIQTQGSMNIELLVNSYDDYTLYSLEKSMVFSFYFGAIIIMLIYNFILYLYIKDRSYLYYLLFHVNYLFFALSLNGFSASYIWPNFPFINTFLVPLLMSIGSSIAVIFTIEFLHIKTTSPKIYRLMITLFWVNITMSLLVFFLGYHYSSLLASLISLISIIIILGSSLYSHFISKNPHAKFFALAWGSLLLGIFTIHFRNLGILPVNFFTSYSPLIGAFFELTLLALALAYRYNLQKEELSKKNIMLHKQSRLASMGEMINNIAHQWRQPLNRVNLSLAVIKKVLDEEMINNEFINKKIKNSEINIQYMSQTINDFADFFSSDKKEINFDVYKTLEKSLKLIESRLNGITVHYPQNIKIEIDGFVNEFIQVILVILNNAIDNFEINSVQQRDIYLSISNNEESITVGIVDNGGGINHKNIDYIFDPYFSTKFKHEGTGVGLYMAKMLIENSMNGNLKVYSQDNTTKFEIKLWRSNHE